MVLLGNGANPRLTAATVGHSTLLLTEGDSLTDANGEYSSFGQTPWPNLYLAASTNLVLQNSAVSGSYLSSVISREAANIAYIAANPGKTNYMYAVMIGINNANAGPQYYPTDWSGFATDFAAHLTRMRAGGFNKIIAGTITSFDPVGTAAKETFRINANALTRAFTAPTADAIMDVGATTYLLGAPTAYLDTLLIRDGLHETQAGQIYLEQAFAAVANPLLA